MKILVVFSCIFFISCAQMNIVGVYKNTKDMFEYAKDVDSQVPFQKHIEYQEMIMKEGKWEFINNKLWEGFSYLVQIHGKQLNNTLYEVENYKVNFLTEYDLPLSSEMFVVAEPRGVKDNILQFQPRLVCQDDTFCFCRSITNNYAPHPLSFLIEDYNSVSPGGEAGEKCKKIKNFKKIFKSRIPDLNECSNQENYFCLKQVMEAEDSKDNIDLANHGLYLQEACNNKVEIGCEHLINLKNQLNKKSWNKIVIEVKVHLRFACEQGTSQACQLAKDL